LGGVSHFEDGEGRVLTMAEYHKHVNTAARNILKCEAAEAKAAREPKIRSIEDVASVRSFASQRIEWLIEPIFAIGNVVLLTAEPGGGKSTIVLSMADAISRGKPFAGYRTQQRPVLYLDLENPLSTVVERMDRLGINDGPSLKMWGGWCEEEPPEANCPIVREYVAACAMPPLIVVDSLISFFKGSENDSAEIRAHMHGYRQLAHLGATVLVLHHTGKADSSKEYRGSSDIKAAVDVAYHLVNLGDPARLSLLRLRAFKSRITVAPEVILNYRDGQFTSSEPFDRPSNTDLLIDLLKQNPRIKSKEFQDLALEKGLGRNRASEFIKREVDSGRIRVSLGDHNTRFHSWAGDKKGDPDELF
jgi:hypothetical protein